MILKRYIMAIVFCGAIAWSNHTYNCQESVSAKYSLRAGAVVFVVLSWRLFTKKVKSTEQQYSYKDLLKIWRLVSKDYWYAFDEKIVGTLEKVQELTVVKFNSETGNVEVSKGKDLEQRATGLLGDYIYKRLLSPFKKAYDHIRPIADCLKALQDIGKFCL